ncbi:putative bifunctional inhibitor/plant lipid transfer protein/seed storage helical [Helianthus annuus]|uniref:Bifunctional inhibitor/plant lipid transfer protein/seed storage helical n=1 Tax=Helianthus annuus TaxID=4232 RepID=A0A159B8H9_HELAN|nr:2S sulfur-rich seed storage protein 2 [Helianthus annuus]AKM13306.1 seed storage albumin 13 precursor [Helianthus annuus]KAF5766636.1 putative bifunctional inhibitor/plant lipid transfer protein/seed storage helical [Helianthus annuus]KAJ0452989.1 putative AAI/SS protein [Helianthus annuus]KAJ0458066.1 putative bifunctional inhibitor/plant lipid transfer protein/seed storage helical [Helianthus annuus]KAJ0474906.1 putative AAI/SS protein [Helianthus annuus]
MATTQAIFVFLLVIGIWTFVEASTEVNCPSQIKQQPMQYCHMFLSRYGAATAVTRPQDSLLQRCCQQLGKLAQRCRCMEIREFVRVQQQGGGWDAPRMKRLLKEAPNLPKTCSLGPGSCPV